MARTATAAVLACLILAGLAVSASAQAMPPLPPKPGGSAPPKLTPPKPAKAEPAEEKRALSGEKVEILLPSGVLIRGVVKGPHCEVIEGNSYRPAKNRDVPGAGLRVWFAFGLNGYMFVPYEAMKEIRFPGELSPEEGKKLAASLEEGRKKAEEDRARVAERLKAMKEAEAKAREREAAGAQGSGKETAGKPKTGTGKTAAATPADERMKKIRALLERFPPEKWKPSRLDEIKRRAIILDLYPTEEERAFMDNYDLWLQGYELWSREHPETPKATKPSSR